VRGKQVWRPPLRVSDNGGTDANKLENEKNSIVRVQKTSRNCPADGRLGYDRHWKKL